MHQEQLISNAELTILSLVVQGCAYGYEIEQVIQERNMRAWTEIGFSSIYRILNQLENKGLVASSLGEKQGRGPARKIYQVTESGQAAFTNASLQTLRAPTITYSSFNLGLHNLLCLPREQALPAMQTYLAGLQQEYHRQEQEKRLKTPPGPYAFYIEAMFDYSLKLLDAEITWLQDFIQRYTDLPQ